MKRLGILVLTIIFTSAVSLAQDRGGRENFSPEESAKRQTEQIKEAVGLKADQEKKVYEINLESSKKMSELRSQMQGGGGGFEGMREAFGKIREEQDKKMKEVLTEEQWVKYEKWQEERRQRRGQRGNN